VSGRDLGASVRQRLLNQSRAQNRPFQELLQYFAMERFLYRLAKSPHADRFILKGALLLTAWRAPVSRPTMARRGLPQGIEPIRLLSRPSQPIRKRRSGLDGAALSFRALASGLDHPANPISPFAPKLPSMSRPSPHDRNQDRNRDKFSKRQPDSVFCYWSREWGR